MSQRIEEIRRLLREGRPVAIRNGEVVDARAPRSPAQQAGQPAASATPNEAAPVGAAVQVKPHTWGVPADAARTGQEAR